MHPVSTVDQVVAVLREAIVQGGFRPGEPLREIALTRELGVSRNTLREALRTLAVEGFVTYQHNRGCSVRQTSAQDVADLYVARGLLERTAVLQVASAPDERLHAVRAALRALEDAAPNEPGSEVLARDLAFHASLVAIHASTRLDRFFAALSDELRLCLALVRQADQEAERSDALIEQHREICTAVVERRGADAHKLLSAHLAYNERRLLELLKNIPAAASG